MMRIVALDPSASQQGLTIGMALTAARAQVPALDVMQIDRQADGACLQACAAAGEIFTPLVAIDGHDGLILDITGCAHLFDGERGLHAAIRRRFAALGLTTRATIAATPDAAHALARFSKMTIVTPGEEEASVRGLPVTALESDTETTVSLVRAGLRTLGDLIDRPMRMLAARFGEALTRKLQRVFGREDRRIAPERPLPDCMAERHFPDPLTELIGLQAVFLALARDVCDVLEQRGSGGRRFEASLFRCDGVVQRLAIETSAPCRDAAAVLRLLSLRMETLADPLNPGFGFDAVRLAVSVVDAVAEQQSSLDGRAVEDHAVSELVDRLVIRFGRDRVLQFVACDTHDPTRAGILIPATQNAGPAVSSRTEPGEPPLRPLQLFQRPQPIEVLAEVPDAPPLRFRWRRVLHEIARAEGPERIAPDWWLEGNRAPATRDYYRIEDTHGRRFWVFREGLYGEDDRPRWFMHGLFA